MHNTHVIFTKIAFTFAEPVQITAQLQASREAFALKASRLSASLDQSIILLKWKVAATDRGISYAVSIRLANWVNWTGGPCTFNPQQAHSFQVIYHFDGLIGLTIYVTPSVQSKLLSIWLEFVKHNSQIYKIFLDIGFQFFLWNGSGQFYVSFCFGVRNSSLQSSHKARH